MRDSPAGLNLAGAGVQLLDADGDGRADLLTTTDELAGYFPLRFDGRWDRGSFQRYRAAPSLNLEDPDVQLVDLDGDGVTTLCGPARGSSASSTIPRRAGTMSARSNAAISRRSPTSASPIRV
jgi:hypothetical protein